MSGVSRGGGKVYRGHFIEGQHLARNDRTRGDFPTKYKKADCSVDVNKGRRRPLRGHGVKRAVNRKMVPYRLNKL